MQLFVLDRDPADAAGMLCDVHLRKMCLENPQILSSCLVLRGVRLAEGMPRPFNVHHPVIKALDSAFKLNWCVAHNDALHQEYRRRFGKNHCYYFLCQQYRELLFAAGAFAADWSFCRNFKGVEISEPDIVEAYRVYYRFKKTLLRRWSYTNAAEPLWLRQ